MVFHGTNGTLHLTREGWSVEGDKVDWSNDKEPALRTASFKKEGKDSHLEHVLNFLEAVRSHKAPIASIELHYNTVAACHLANVSLKVGRKIFWDAQKELCFKDGELKTPDSEANVLLGREYRRGYELPKV